jgi:hypothetical protein
VIQPFEQRLLCEVVTWLQSFREVAMRQLVMTYVALMVQLMRLAQQQSAWPRLRHLHGECVHQYLSPLPLQELHQAQMQAFEQLE